MFADIPALYHAWIEKIVDFTGFSHTMLHIHAGLFVLILARLITRKPLASFIPFTFVVAAEALNEVMNRLYYGSWRPADSVSDVVNTLFWPLMLWMVLRLQPLTPLRNATP